MSPPSDPRPPCGPDFKPLGGGTVVHLTAEYWPFARTGGLAEAVRGLAEHQAGCGQPTAVVMPLYREIREHTDHFAAATEPFELLIGPRRERGRAYRYTGKDVGVKVFFIDHEEYFDRGGVYGENGADYPDNLRRFAYFCRAALHALPQIVPDAVVVHSHDWHAALTNPYLRVTLADEPFFQPLPAVLSVHNAAYQGYFDPGALPEVGLPWSLYDWRALEWHGHVNILKGGLVFADMATTVSPTHAEELRTPDGGFGLHDHFISMGDRFQGIVNGIDYAIWDPSIDPHLTATYTAHHLLPKLRCKTALQRAYRLPQRRRTPVVAMSARLVEQKGFDLLLAPGIVARVDAQFIFLGRGDLRYEAALTRLAKTAPDRIAVPLDFSERLEHRLLAGADILLMPSQFEPCGLTQMRAQRYGAVPLVRGVGGLSDTVADGRTGFLFRPYHPDALLAALQRATLAYRARDGWNGLMTNGMAVDFTWGPSAVRYQAMYHRARAHRARRR